MSGQDPRQQPQGWVYDPVCGWNWGETPPVGSHGWHARRLQNISKPENPNQPPTEGPIFVTIQYPEEEVARGGTFAERMARKEQDDARRRQEQAGPSTDAGKVGGKSKNKGKERALAPDQNEKDQKHKLFLPSPSTSSSTLASSSHANSSTSVNASSVERSAAPSPVWDNLSPVRKENERLTGKRLPRHASSGDLKSMAGQVKEKRTRGQERTRVSHLVRANAMRQRDEVFPEGIREEGSDVEDEIE